MRIVKSFRSVFLSLFVITACAPGEEPIKQTAVSDWKLYQDAKLEFKFPPGYEVRNVEDTWVATRWIDDRPLLGASLMLWMDRQEARDLMTHYGRYKMAGGYISKPRSMRINASDCLLFDTEEGLKACCYARNSLFYQVATTIKSNDMPEGMTRQILAANFEKFLRSIKFK